MACITVTSKTAGEALRAALLAGGKHLDASTGSRWVPQTWYADADAYPICLRHGRFPADVLTLAATVNGVTVEA